MGQFQSLPLKVFLTQKRTEYSSKTTAASSSAALADDLDFASFLKIICAFLLISHWIKSRHSSLSKEQSQCLLPSYKLWFLGSTVSMGLNLRKRSSLQRETGSAWGREHSPSKLHVVQSQDIYQNARYASFIPFQRKHWRLALSSPID